MLRTKPLTTWKGVFAIALCLALMAPEAQAFCPNNGYKCGFGGVGITHKDMTRETIESLNREFFGTTRMTKSMKNAIEEVWKANAEVDVNQVDGFWHFDGESFTTGRNRVRALMDGVVRSLEADDGPGARAQLGQALHTIQDFYSHSNFIESGGSGALRALWRADVAMPAQAATTEATCRPCPLVEDPPGSDRFRFDCRDNIITPRLTSGYYGGENEVPQVPGKCRHGGMFDSGPGPLGGINKDVTLELFAPHHFLHRPAAAAAQQATEQFIRDIKERITPRQLKLLFGVGPTLAFAIDTTGSMGGVITQVRQQAIRIVDERIGTDQEPLRYILSPFNDPSVGPLTVTDNPNVFKLAILALRADGGGDCPELAMAGQISALAAADRGVDLFTFTDADAKDAGRAGAVSSLAAYKDAKIFPILNGACSYSWMSTEESANIAASDLDPAVWVPNVDPAYRRIAADSGGQVFLLETSEVGRVTELADAAARANAVDLVSIADRLDGSVRSYALDVDSTLEQVTFSLSGLTALSVQRPDGRLVDPTDADVRLITLSSGRLLTVSAPEAGEWTATVAGTGEFSLSVLGDSRVDLDRFDFVALAGRPDHGGLFDIVGFPLAGQPATIATELSGDIASAQFELIDKRGVLLTPLVLANEEEGDPNEFFGPAELPAGPFLAQVRGTLGNGERFQRVMTTRVLPQPVQILPPQPQPLRPGGQRVYVFEVKNFGSPDRFRFSASDDRGFVNAVSPSSFDLGSGASTLVEVRLQVPSHVAQELGHLLTTTAESQTDPDVRNFAVLRSRIEVQGVDCSAAAPSLQTLWPVNHAFVPVTIVGVNTHDGAAAEIRIDAISQSEPPRAPGAAATCPDARGVGTSTAELRAERSGGGAGRVYTIGFSATAGSGACSGEVQVCVPHHQHARCAPTTERHDATRCAR